MFDMARQWTSRWAFVAVLLCGTSAALCQAPDSGALDTVRAAVAAELQASRTDKSNWIYNEHNTTPDKNAVYKTVETPQGSLKRLVDLNGHKLSGDAQQRETDRILAYVHDTAAQARERKAAAHDDAQATEMLKMLPEAFIWTRVSQNTEAETLNYRPNPAFQPPDMQSRVMSTMSGEMVIDRGGHRIRTLKGALTGDVRIGFGILGKLDRGGTFQVERRELAPGIWQITETRVHIGGHALLFHTIGQQEDDIKTDWQPSTAKTLEEAAHVLGAER